MILAAIISFLAILIFKLLNNLKKWRKGIPVDHAKEAAIVTWCMLIPGALCFTASNLEWYYKIPNIIAMQFFAFWVLFDGLYNVFRKFNWWFTGSDDADDAKTDNFLQRLTLWQHVLLKVVPLAGNIFLYIKFM